MQASGNHQMEDEPYQPGIPADRSLSVGWKITFNADCDALADPAQCFDCSAFNTSEGRIDSAQKEDAGDADTLQRLAKNTHLECGNISGDVGQFRHCTQIASSSPFVARTFCGEVN
jgi:hypothetical protein